MPKIVWFALGAVAGMVYASRLIEKERLDQPGGMLTTSTEPPQGQKEDGREKMAAIVQERAQQMGDMIAERWSILADKLRSTQKGKRTESVMEPVSSPFGQPATMDTRQAASVGATYEPNLGLEANR